MKNRSPLNLKKVIIVWNLFLSIFNFFVTLKVLPIVIYILYQYSLTGLLIIPPIYLYGFDSVGLWICLYIISKYVELLDTFFLIFRKKQITLLHWFHHSTVLLYTWDTYFVELPAGVTFTCVNATVHTIMYFYYFLSTLYGKPLKWNIYVTILQILQMIFGIFITIYCLYISFTYEYNDQWNLSLVQNLQKQFSFRQGHYISKKNILCACAMYLSYFYLFVRYFVNRYFDTKDIKKKKT